MVYYGLLLNSILLDRIVLVSYALQVFIHTMIILYCCVSRNTCSYDSRATQILELGVSEFCSTVPNSYVKSRLCFRVLSRNSQRGEIVKLNFINHLVGFTTCQICLYFSN